MAEITKPLSDLIKWNFTLTAQGLVTRYGTAGGSFYKQFLPFGQVNNDKNPPKLITPQLYALAESFLVHPPASGE